MPFSEMLQRLETMRDDMKKPTLERHLRDLANAKDEECDTYAADLMREAADAIDRITAERDGLASTVDVLESNARLQAKLLADTGRERDGLRKALTRALRIVSDRAAGGRMLTSQKEAEETFAEGHAALATSDADKPGA